MRLALVEQVLVGETGVRFEMISGPLRDTELLALCHKTGSTAHSVCYCPASTIVAETSCLIVAQMFHLILPRTRATVKSLC